MPDAGAVTHIIGLGGFFIKAQRPEELTAWYRDVLGVGMDEYGGFEQAAGQAVFAAFAADSDYFGSSGQGAMLNLRVRELPGLLEALRAAGAVTSEEITVMDGVGRFAWVEDPEGNRIELWEEA